VPVTDVDHPELSAHLVERSRSSFRSLIAANPNHFGSFPDIGLDVVEPKAGDTTYESLSCVGYSQRLDRIEATVVVPREFGYSGGLCSQGSFEYVRFHVDYGSGWSDAGLAAIAVHDIPAGKDCRGQDTHPLSYVCGIDHAPKRDWCGSPVMPKVRAILSWEVAPPAGQPDWTPVWGDVHDCRVTIAPRRFVLGDIAAKIPAEVLTEIPSYLLEVPPLPVPNPDPLPVLGLAELSARYQQTEVAARRFAFPQLTHLSGAGNSALSDMAASASLAKALGIDLSGVFGQWEETAGDTSYEELDCLGLDVGLRSLVATFRVKKPSGYSGPSCSAGSVEHVAFWADWGEQCQFRYLGTTDVVVHDYADLKDELCFAATLPVDLGALFVECEQSAVRRVRAVLSWGTVPSTTDPDAVPVWGNRIDRHLQLPVGRRYDGLARFDSVGGVAVDHIDPVTGVTMAGAVLGASTTPLNPPACPFTGNITVQGPPDPALAGHRYRIRAVNVDAGGSVLLTTPFSVVGSSSATTIIPDPVEGWVPWPVFAVNSAGLLGVFTPGGDDRWDLQLELDTPGNVQVVSRVQLDSTIRTTIEPGDGTNAGDLQITTGGACRWSKAAPLAGTFVARDRHFSRWSISVLGGPGGPVPPTPLTLVPALPATTETLLSGQAFELNLSALEACGYVIRLTITDRAIVNSSYQGQSATIDRGICLE
jgi:hypothetical protein